jgi:hypothetical protein
MPRPSKRIVSPLFLLLVAAAIFAPDVRGDGVPMVSFSYSDTWFFTLPQDPVPDVVGTDFFEFIQVPVFASFMPANTPLTYDVFFSRQPGSTTFQMFCDPFIVSQTDPPFFNCDFNPRADVQSDTVMWSGPLNGPAFTPGVYGALTITETPEPSTLALLLMSFATLFLLAVGVRPNHR